MRQFVALKVADESKFLADHPRWTIERQVEDDQGIVWLSFRVDMAAERKVNLLLAIAMRAIDRVVRNPKPIYVGS